MILHIQYMYDFGNFVRFNFLNSELKVVFNSMQTARLLYLLYQSYNFFNILLKLSFRPVEGNHGT